MRFLALFSGRIDPAAQPPDLSARHFDWLRGAAAICSFGGLRPAGGGPFEGAAWMIEAESEEDARRLIDADPYTAAGLWDEIRLWRWSSPAPADTPSHTGVSP